MVLGFFCFYFNGSSCNSCPFPLVFLQGIAKNSGLYPLLFPISFITHIDKTPPQSFFFSRLNNLDSLSLHICQMQVPSLSFGPFVGTRETVKLDSHTPSSAKESQMHL